MSGVVPWLKQRSAISAAKAENRRHEESTRTRDTEASGAAAKNAPPDYVSPLIQYKYNNYDLPRHQRKMATLSAIGYAIVVKTRQNAFDDGFELVDMDGNVTPELEAVMQKLHDLNALWYLTQAAITEAMYGFSWFFVGKEKLEESLAPKTIPERRVTNLDYFGPENTEIKEYNDHGFPSKIDVTVLKGTGKTQSKEVIKTMNRADLIHFRTRPEPQDRSHEGLPVLYPVWSTLWSLERAMHSSDFYLSKFGHGMFTVFTKKTLNDNENARLVTTMEEASISRVVIVSNRKVEKIEFVNADGSNIDFPTEIDSRLNIIAAGVGIPKDILVGLSTGQITGSETNIKTYYQALNLIQSSFKPGIRELVAAVGYTPTNYRVRFVTRYAHDKLEESKIFMNNAQTLAIKSGWLTINELREIDGYDKIAGGDVLRADFLIESSFQTAEESDATNNPEGGKT